MEPDFAARHWYRRSWLSFLLLPLAALFGVIVRVRRRLVRAERLPVPVIVVGNFTAGGTGKTPLVIWLIALLRDAGRRPGVISRGYGARAARACAVPPDGDPLEFGDEPRLIAGRTGAPVWIGRDRLAAARGLLAAHPDVDVIIADDGLQHLRLGRDVEIEVIDARGYGNGFLQPAGPLRERPRKLDARVVNGAPAADGGFAMQLRPTRFYFVHDPTQSVRPDVLRARKLHAVAGIGAPERFFRALEAMDIRAVAHPFPDHHRFARTDLDFADCDWVLMTEKDAVKCAAFSDRTDLVTLQVDAVVEPGSVLVALVLDKLRGFTPP